MADAPLVEALDAALGSVLAARVMADPICLVPCPELPLDVCLSRNSDYQAAKAPSAMAMDALLAALDESERNLALEVESALRAEAVVIADCAFAVGLVATAHSR